MVMVYRPGSDDSPAAEGWLPLGVVTPEKNSDKHGGQSDAETGGRKSWQNDSGTRGRRSWHVRFRKPSFTKSKSRDSLGTTKGGSLDRVARKQGASLPKVGGNEERCGFFLGRGERAAAGLPSQLINIVLTND